MKKLSVNFILISVVMLLCIHTLHAGQNSAATINIDLDTGTAGIQTARNLALNEVFDVDVVINGAVNLKIFNLAVTFPQNILELQTSGVTQGNDLFPTTDIFLTDFDTPGKVGVTGGVMANTSAVSGSGVLFHLKFKVLSTEQADLQFLGTDTQTLQDNTGSTSASVDDPVALGNDNGATVNSVIVIDSAKSSVTATTPAKIDEESTITITARDPAGNPIEGIPTVDIEILLPSDCTITQPPTATNASGVSIAKFTSTKAQIVNITVIMGATTLNDKPSVVFTDGVLPTVAFSSAGSNDLETTSAVSLPVVLNKSSANTITVSYSVTGGTATGVDYTLGGGSLTFSAGQTSDNIPLTVINDLLYENNETVIVTLSTPTNATLGTPVTHTYTITNDDPLPSVGFAVSTSNGLEDNTPAELTVNISAASGLDVTVNYSVTGGTASSGTDYTSVNGTLTFPAGETGSQTVSIPIIDDDLDEDNETVIVTLSNPTNAGIGTESHTYTIIDNNDDQPEISITSAGPTSGEEGAVSQVTMVVNLSKPSGKTVTVDYLVSGDVDEGDDYTVAAGPLTFSPGEISKNITLTIVNDNIGELDETIIVTLSNPTNADMGTPASYTYTITNDDKSSIEFTEISSSGLEAISPATLTVTLAPSFPGTVTVDYSVISGGTATGGGEDYTLANGTLTFAAGDTEKYINITITADQLHESDETIVVQLSNSSGNATIGTKESHTYTITDDDSEPSVEFNVAGSDGPESSSSAALTVNISGASAEDVIVNYSVAPVTATDGQDYTSTAGTLTFPAGETAPQTISITIMEDSLDEDNETFTVTLSKPPNAALGTNSTHTYTINDNDDPPSVEFAFAGSEDVEGTVSQKTLVVNLSSASGKTETVNYLTSGDADEGGDYTISAGPLTFSPGETTKNITLTILDDNAGEADETVIVTLEPANATLGTNSSYTYKILNDDKSSVEFTTAISSGPEADSPVLLSVSLLPAIQQTVTVDYSVTGTATEGGDYTLLGTGTLTFSPLDTEETITLAIVDDDTVEPDETIEITLTNPSDDATIGTNESHIYTIINDDDVNEPGMSDYIPEPNSVQVARDTIIQLHITDEIIGSTSGVDANTVTIQVEGVPIYDGSAAEPNGTYISAMGICRRLGTEADYMFTFQTSTMFDYEQKVDVVVNAEDKAGNLLTDNYHFYTVMRSFGTNIKVNSDTGTLVQDHPATAVDSEGNIWVVWDQTTAAGNTDIFISTLLEDESAFEDSVPVISNSNDQRNPAIAIDSSDKLYVTWEERDHSDPNSRWNIFVSPSINGIDWATPVHVDPCDAAQISPAIAIDGSNLAYIVWEDLREGNKDIRVATSNNATTWDPTPITTDANDQSEPAIVINSVNVAVVGWTDGGNIYGAASDGGWEIIDVVTTGSIQSTLAIAPDSSDVMHHLWVDNEGGYDDIYYAMGEVPLTGSSIIDEPNTTQTGPAIAVPGSGSLIKVFACWGDDRNLAGYSDPVDIYYVEKTGTDFGTNILVNDDVGVNTQTSPAIGVDINGNPYMVWVDNRLGNSDIYAVTTTSIGNTLGSTHVKASDPNTQIVQINETSGGIDDANDVTIEVPSGALSVDTTITIAELHNPPELPPGGFGVCYEFSPSGLEFTQPVTITIAHAAADCPGHATYDVYCYHTETGTWSQDGISDVEHLTSSQDPNLPSDVHVVRFKTTHFTGFGIGGAAPGVVSGGGGGGGCAISPNTQGSVTEYMLPYAFYIVALLIITLKDSRNRKTI